MPGAVRRLAVATLSVLAALTGLVAVADPAAAGLKGSQRVAHWTPKDLTPTKQHHVACPEGTVVISGGAEIDGPEVGRIELLRPDQQLNRFEAGAYMPQGAEPWRLIVYAICAAAPAGLTYVTAASTAVVPGSQLRTAVAFCPKGTQVIGMGARASVERERHVELESMFTNQSRTGVVAWTNGVQPVGEKKDWTTEAYAVCAAMPDGELDEAWYPFTLDHGNRMWVSCGQAKPLGTGSGFETVSDNAHGWIWLHDLIPDADQRSTYVETHKSKVNLTDEWYTIASVICV
jgi:hypothetical protein